MHEPLRIDIVFDFVCPWCYIGKRRLEAALEMWRIRHPDDPAPLVRWLPYQLHPEVPAGGMTRLDYLERKHGLEGPDLEKQRHIAALGESLGLELAFDKITVQPNTIDAHRLAGCAQIHGWQDAFVEAVFKAYFTDGIDLNDHDALVSLATSVGFEWGDVAMYLGTRTDVETVTRIDAQARAAGIDIVPFFIFNGRITVPGAHDVDVLFDAMSRAVMEATT